MTDSDSDRTRRETLRKGILVLSGLAFGGAATSANTQAANAETVTFHDETVLPTNGTCLGEDVQLDARGHMVVQGGPDEDRYHVHLQVHGDAIGTESGTVYEFSEAINDVYPNESGTFHSRLASLLVSRDSGPNLFVEWHLHTTINANGEVTAVKIEPFSFECRGETGQA